MNLSQRIFWGVAVGASLAVIGLAWLLYLCGQQGDTYRRQADRFRLEATRAISEATRINDFIAKSRVGCNVYAEALGFVPNRFILMAPKTRITDIFVAANLTPTAPVDRINLGPTLTEQLLSSPSIRFAPSVRPDLVVDLYEIGECDGLTLTVTSAVSNINGLDFDQFQALADLDYLTAKPWTIKPTNVPVQPVIKPDCAVGDLETQWAAQGPPGGYHPDATPTDNGQNVVVGVFDTAPFANTGPRADPFPLNFVRRYTVPPAGSPALVPSHGLFVASLVHQIAPDAEIWLYEVLSGDGHGTLFELDKAITDFRSDLKALAPPRHAVVNLSLALDPTSSGPSSEITSFTNLLALTVDSGIVVVGAAGSEAVMGSPVPTPMYPANLPDVTAVASNNRSGMRSCYSNDGDLAAPGGDGDAACHAAVNNCWQNPDNCVVGIIADPSAPGAYVCAYWAGSSFSTAWTSGLAAEIFGSLPQPVPFNRIGSTDVTTQLIGNVRHAPPGTVGLGAGIIDEDLTIP